MAKKRRQETQPEKEEDDSDHEEQPCVTSEDHDGVEDDELDEAISSEEEDENDGEGPSEPSPLPAIRSSITSDGRYHNKQRMLLLSSRGVTARYRHLLEDLRTLIPHSKKESKLDVGK